MVTAESASDRYAHNHLDMADVAFIKSHLGSHPNFPKEVGCLA